MSFLLAPFFCLSVSPWISAFGLVITLGSIFKNYQLYYHFFQFIVYLTHSSESKMGISFKEQFCSFFHECCNSLHAYAFGLFTNCSKKVSRESFWHASIGGWFITCQMQKNKLNGEQQKLFYSWGLPGISKSDFLVVLDLSVTVEDTTTILNTPYFLKKNCDLMHFFLARKRQRFCIQQQSIIRVKVERQGSLKCFNQIIVFRFYLFQKTWTQSSSCRFSLLVAST